MNWFVKNACGRVAGLTKEGNALARSQSPESVKVKKRLAPIKWVDQSKSSKRRYQAATEMLSISRNQSMVKMRLHDQMDGLC
jgi:hypothetical protein